MTVSFSKDFEELFAYLNARGVKALIVGGHALAFHAKPRFTKDIDILVEPSQTNAAALLLALADFGFSSLELGVEDFSTPGNIVQLGFPPNRVDLLTAISGVDFATAWRSRVAGKFGSQDVFYIGKAELIANKTAAARPQDLVDVKTLADSEDT